jgi:AcrR family transcriptional regulator
MCVTNFEAIPPAGDCPVERGKHDKEGRQRALIEAATSVFAEYGYDAATTRAVAERAGCSEGLIHRYFGSKQGLLLRILEQRAFAQAAEFEATVPAADDLEAEIAAMLQFSLEVNWRNQDPIKVSMTRAMIDPAVGETIAHRFHATRVESIERRLQRHRAAGRVDPDADLHAVSVALSGLGFALGFTGQVIFRVDRAQVSEACRETARLVARGLEPRTTRSMEASGHPREVAR